MREVDCAHCGDTVCVPQAGETVVNGETPLAHIERTGHPHVSEPVALACDDCGHLWMYTGDSDRPTCPNCKGKRTVPAADIA